MPTIDDDNVDRTDHIAQVWASYLQACVPAGASQGQVDATYRAFMAGALTVHSALSIAGDMTPDRAERFVRSITAEIGAFKGEVAKRASAERAGGN